MTGPQRYCARNSAPNDAAALDDSVPAAVASDEPDAGADAVLVCDEPDAGADAVFTSGTADVLGAAAAPVHTSVALTVGVAAVSLVGVATATASVTGAFSAGSDCAIASMTF